MWCNVKEARPSGFFRGLTNRQIGRELGISEGTVRKHLEHVYARLGVTNRMSAVAAYPDLIGDEGSQRAVNRTLTLAVG